MKVLIATQGQYVSFINKVVQSCDISEHTIIMNFRKPTSDWIDYDVGISFMWQSKIQKHELEGRTWFNFHPAPLPEYKGRNLCYHAIMNGEKEFGATLHYMDENFDTGDIIEVGRFEIPCWWTAENLSNAAIEMSRQLFKIYFPFILERKEFKRIPNVGGNYYPKNPIDDYLFLSDQDELKKQIRAITYKNFYPKLDVNGVVYKIVKDE